MFKDIVSLVNKTLSDWGAPYQIKQKKTRYGSRKGANWNLGVMLNKDNQITIGHEKKKHFRAMLDQYILDKQNNHPWELSEVQTLNGYIAYYKMIEKDYVEALINKVNIKRNVDVMALIKSDLTI